MLLEEIIITYIGFVVKDEIDVVCEKCQRKILISLHSQINSLFNLRKKIIKFTIKIY